MPDFAKLKPEMDGIANNFSVRDYALREDYWGLSFAGFIKIEEDNFYHLMIKADDAGRFYVNNKVVVDETTLVKGANVGAVALKKGFHPIRIEFLEKIGNQRLRVYIKKSGAEEWTQLDEGHFFHN
jgi:hexosaminidase